MSDVRSNTRIAAPGLTREPRRRASMAVLAAVTFGLLAGCADRHSIVVGSVPEDYRTNHPIVIAERDEVLDLAVGAGERGRPLTQRASHEGLQGH